MIVETTHGQFELLNNTKEAFDILKFQERYVPEIYDKYDYIVGDISSEMLRLKGFYEDTSKEQNKNDIVVHLNETCNYYCGYYILKRIK